MSPILSWFDLNKAIVKPHPSKKATFKNDITDLNPHQKKPSQCVKITNHCGDYTTKIA